MIYAKLLLTWQKRSVLDESRVLIKGDLNDRGSLINKSLDQVSVVNLFKKAYSHFFQPDAKILILCYLMPA